MRKPLFIANWKMHKTVREAEAFFADFAKLVPGNLDREIVICPPYTLLQLSVSKRKFEIGAQDVYWENQGAYTGEISPLMLKDLGCSHVIIGHSERRRHFGETDEAVNKKVLASLGQGL